MTEDEKMADGFLALVLFIPAVVWGGFVMMKLWNWFVAPLGVTTLTLWWAVGLDVLVSFVVFKTPDREVPEAERAHVTGRFIIGALAGALCLGIGAIAHALAW